MGQHKNFSGNPLALQLYTVRDECAQDFLGVLDTVTSIGYGAVEFAGLHGKSPQQVKAVMADCGLKSAGFHTSLDQLQNDLAKTLEDYCGILESPYVIVSSAPEEFRKSANDWKRFRDEMNVLAEKCSAQGVPLCYHNHAFEFDKLDDGQTAHDILFHTDSSTFLSELDIYWTVYGEADPLTELQRLQNRVPLIHVKDMAPHVKEDIEVGEGRIDWKTIFQGAQTAGVKWLVVELDHCPHAPLQSARMCVENLWRAGLN